MAVTLSVHELTKTYLPTKRGGKPFTAVDHISFEMNEGEVLGLLGPNGAGKSTTISMLMGVLKPTSGTITFFGKDFAQHRSEILNHVTFGSTYVKMPWRLTVIENLRVYGLYYGVSGDVFENRAQKFLEFFGVWDQRHKTMNELSAGQSTRVMLAKAFIPHPKVVLLDEPTASLDPDIAHQVRHFVKLQQQEFHTTVLYTSHNMDEVTDVCDRVVFLRHGHIVAVDTPEKLARSVSTAHMHLQVKDGLKRIEQFATAKNLPFTTDDREVEIEIDEHHIAAFLTQLAEHKIEYTQITIGKPTLEDYFLHMAGGKDES